MQRLRRGSRRFRRDAARIISTICNPFFTAFALFVLISHEEASGAVDFWRLSLTSALFAAIGPMLFIFWCYANDRISDLDMSVRSERERLFGVFVLFYAVGTLVLVALHAPHLLIATMAGYTANTLIVGIITRYWKISTHAIGITAPLTVLTIIDGAAPLPYLSLIPLVGWARLYLHAHTPAQVIAGVALGATSVIGFFHVFHLV